jgi:signal transduction histidine kinase
MVTGPISSARAKLTLLYGAVLALIVCVFALGTFLFVKERLYAELDAQLERELSIIERVYREEPGELADLPKDRGYLFFQIIDGARVRHESDGWRQISFAEPAETPASWTAPDGTHFRTQALAASGHRVAAAVDESAIRHIVSTLGLILALGIPFALVLAVAGGYVLAGRALVPVQAAFDRLRQFTSDASHELRTPLTAMRSVGEVALRSKRDVDHYRNVIGSMLEEVDRLTNLAENLLTLTRADSGAVRLGAVRGDLSELARGVTDQLRILAEEKRQTIRIDASEPVYSWFDLNVLRLAASNLLHNAIKYTPEGGSIHVRVAPLAHGEAVLEVRDSGPGIALAHRKNVFERFYRIDEARSQASGGAGLGLAIARWAVEAHGGRIELDQPLEGGALFRIIISGSAPR